MSDENQNDIFLSREELQRAIKKKVWNFDQVKLENSARRELLQARSVFNEALSRSTGDPFKDLYPAVDLAFERYAYLKTIDFLEPRKQKLPWEDDEDDEEEAADAEKWRSLRLEIEETRAAKEKAEREADMKRADELRKPKPDNTPLWIPPNSIKRKETTGPMTVQALIDRRRRNTSQPTAEPILEDDGDYDFEKIKQEFLRSKLPKLSEIESTSTFSTSSSFNGWRTKHSSFASHQDPDDKLFKKHLAASKVLAKTSSGRVSKSSKTSSSSSTVTNPKKAPVKGKKKRKTQDKRFFSPAQWAAAKEEES